jgi:hypothetical protein
MPSPIKKELAENVVEIQFGIHRPARDVHVNRYQEADCFEYETGE